ncbi:MAG: hypothetical protein AAGL08_13030 [Cyanobacteria bacterium J06573_11]
MTTLKDRKPAITVESSPTTVVDSPSTLTVTPSSDTPKPPSKLRRAGRFVARHPRWVQAFLLLALTSGTGCFLLYSLFKGAWTPERDNLTILQTIFKMELERDSTRRIDGDPQQVVTRSYQSLEPYLEEDGWVWVNRFGSTITYGNQNKRLIASCSPYSPLYMVCSLSEIP